MFPAHLYRCSAGDLCDGEPQCVKFCEVKAVEYVEAETLNIKKNREAAQKISAAQKEAAAVVSDM